MDPGGPRKKKCQEDIPTHRRYPANIYLFKVNNINIRKRCEIYSRLTIKIPE